MTIRVDHQAFDRATQDLATIADGLRREHQRVQGQVDQLLSSTWSGLAAEQFGEGWQQWCQGMDDLLGAIALQGSLLSAVRADLDRTDQTRALASQALRARLGDQA